MLIYEKNNKLNINFDNEVGENPDVQIGKDGINLDGATISKDSVLPTPNIEEDIGKTVVVDENGMYALGEKKTYTATGQMTSATEGTWTSDYDFSELQEAFLEGNNVIVNITNMGSVAVQWINAVGSLCAYSFITKIGIVFCEATEDGTIKVTGN